MSAQTATNLHTTCRLISFGSLSSPTFAKAHMTRFLGHSSRDVLGGKARLSGPATASVTRFSVRVSESQLSPRQFEQVRLGTCFALQSARLLQEAYTHGVGFAIGHQILAQASSPSSHSPSFSPSQTQRGEDNGFRPMSSRGRDVQADSHNVFRSTSPRLRFGVTITPSNASGRTGRGSGSRGFALISRSRVVALPTDSLRQRQPLLTPSASTW